MKEYSEIYLFFLVSVGIFHKHLNKHQLITFLTLLAEVHFE